MSADRGKGRRDGRACALLLAVAFGFLLTACASSGPQSGDNHRSRYHRGQPSYKVGAAYQINGVWYHPRVDYDYDETGLASWYGEAFDGQATANGEIYDLNQLSAAHKTLPLPSVVEVTNLRNGRSLRLRVNDRGPYVDGRIIDVSRRASQLLGFETSGTTPARVRILKDESIQVAQAAMRGETGRVLLAEAPHSAPIEPRPAPRPTPVVAPAAPPLVVAASTPIQNTPPSRPAPGVAEPPTVVVAASTPIPDSPRPSTTPRHRWPSLISQAHAEPVHAPVSATASGRIFVQAGAFAMPENAQRVRARIASLGNIQVVQTVVNGTPVYRVRLGPVANATEADRLLGKVVGSGYPTARVVSE
jgi:rare lipoprotein A